MATPHTTHRIIRRFGDGPEGLADMKDFLHSRRHTVGGKAKRVCPPETAYGSEGVPRAVPPNAVLTFEVELLEIVRQEIGPAPSRRARFLPGRPRRVTA